MIAHDTEATTRQRVGQDVRRRNALGYAFILIPLSYVFVVLLGPMLFNGWISLHAWSLVDGRPPRFIGLDNYVDIFTNPDYLDIIGLSLRFVLCSVALQVGGGVAVAMFVWRKYPNSDLLRTVLLLPMLVSEVVVGNVWRLMYNPNGGLLNGILHVLHLPPVLWLGPRWAFVSVVTADLWQQLPFVFLVIFAALQSIPTELLEAAEIDGASNWQTFRRIIVPVIRPAILIVVLFETLYAIRMFSTAWILTQGGPAGATRFLGIAIVETTMTDYNVGFAAALSWVVLAISLIIAVLYIRVLRRDPLA